MKGNCSFEKALVIISVMLIGILLISAMPVEAGYYSRVMPVEIYIDSREVVEYKEVTPAQDWIKIGNSEVPVNWTIATVEEGHGVILKFKATIDCGAVLDVLLVNENGEVYSLRRSGSGKSCIEGGGCQVNGEISLSPRSYTFIFLSPGKDGKYGREGKEWPEFLIDCQNLHKKGRNQKQVIDIIIDKTAGAGCLSYDSVNLAKVTVLDIPKPQPFIEIHQLESTKEGKMKITGKTNLDSGTIKWTFRAKDKKIDGKAEIENDKTFSFIVNTIGFRGDYTLTLEVEDSAKEFSGRWPPIVQPTSTPYLIPQVSPAPSVIKQISTRPTHTPITVIRKKRPASAPKPKTDISILTVVAGVAIAMFLKRKIKMCLVDEI